MCENYTNDLIGKTVLIYPGDSDRKEGKIIDIDDNGILFVITKYSGKNDQYIVGKRRYISFSARLSFQEL